MMSLRSSLTPTVRATLLAGLLLGAGAGAQAADLRVASSVTVQAGDTAYSLARRAGLTLDDLLTLNSLSSPALKVGQVLRLRAPTSPVVQAQSVAAPSQAPASLTHTVQPGETLYAIARRYGVGIEALATANSLSGGAVLRAGQTLSLPAGTQGATAAAVPAAPFPEAPAAFPRPGSGVGGSPFLPGAPAPTAPVLQPGAPMPRAQAPALPSAGQSVAQAPASSVPAVSPATVAASPLLSGAADWRHTALALLDTPYAYGGTTPRGTDCSGFVLQVFTPLGYRLPRTSADQARVGLEVAASDLQPGDLVFFDTEGKGRVSHVGIYMGDDQFVSANSYQGRVTVDGLLGDRYWGPRFVLGRRILNGPLATARP